MENIDLKDSYRLTRGNTFFFNFAEQISVPCTNVVNMMPFFEHRRYPALTVIEILILHFFCGKYSNCDWNQIRDTCTWVYLYQPARRGRGGDFAYEGGDAGRKF